MNVTRGELVKLRQQIADGRPWPSDVGEWAWHPRMRLGLRRPGTWAARYRNERGFEKTYKIGSAVVLTLQHAEAAARRVFGRVAHGEDPAEDRKDLRERPKLVVGALCEQYFEAMRESRKLSPRTVRGYDNLAKNYLGVLRGLQADELTPRDVATRVKEIDKQVSPHVARYFRAMLSSVYKWVLPQKLIDIETNPVTGTFRPEETIATPAQALTLDELGAIWRACEMMAGAAARYRGKSEPPTRANSIRAETTLMTRAEAARQSGLHKSVLWRGIKTGALKTAGFRRDLAEEHPMKIKQGYHRRTYLISAGELEHFTNSRLGLTRSPQVEYAAVIRLLMLFGGRYMEFGGLRWSELDLDNRTLYIKTVAPDGERRIKSRGGRPKDLILYLPQAAVDILNTIERRPGRDLVFGSGPRGLLENDRLKKELDATIAKNEGAPLRPWKLHWLRHSFTTHLKEMGVNHYVVEAITNHLGAQQVAAMASHYTHTKYLPQQKQVLEAWASELRAAADRTETKASNVTWAFGHPAETA